MVKMLRVLIVICVYVAAVQGQNYCEVDYCHESRHIGCQNTGAFAATCQLTRQLVNIALYKSFILRTHNGYRNLVASGKLPGFKSASRMAFMQWDDELAKLAEFNVKRCVVGRDCHNTKRFTRSGQNIGFKWSFPVPQQSVPNLIKAFIDEWFETYKNTDQTNVDSNRRFGEHLMPFLRMVGDRNTHIGCAMLHQHRNGGMDFYFTCNYGWSPKAAAKIYVTGSPASQCIRGKDNTFPSLCNSLEPIDTNGFEFP